MTIAAAARSPARSIDRARFFAGIRQGPFPGKMTADQVAGCEHILDEWERRGLTDLRSLAYMLATVKWETDHTMQPIREGGGLKYLKSKRYYPAYGRGFVQLTWDANYKKMAKLIGVPELATNYDLALKPEIATAILFEGMIRGTFTGKKLADYFSVAKTDWINARRIINGTDRASEIAGIAKQFYADLLAASSDAIVAA